MNPRAHIPGDLQDLIVARLVKQGIDPLRLKNIL